MPPIAVVFARPIILQSKLLAEIALGLKIGKPATFGNGLSFSYYIIHRQLLAFCFCAFLGLYHPFVQWPDKIYRVHQQGLFGFALLR